MLATEEHFHLSLPLVVTSLAWGRGRATVTYVATWLAFVGTSIVVGLLLARLLERPSLALRDRLFPSRAGALVAAGTAEAAAEPRSVAA